MAKILISHLENVKWMLLIEIKLLNAIVQGTIVGIKILYTDVRLPQNRVYYYVGTSSCYIKQKIDNHLSLFRNRNRIEHYQPEQANLDTK